METITKYKAFDGREFINQKECESHEEVSRKVLDIASQLPAKHEDYGCSFENGGGYIQHEKDIFLKVRAELCVIANSILPHKWFEETIEKGLDAHSSFAGKIISEIDNRSLFDAWYRFQCTDNQFREWGQPYYASHPDKAENRKLN